MQSPVATDRLEAFLNQPNIEASPAWEFIYGRAQQKPLPTLFHSRFQRNLVNAINRETDAYEAIQELRCIIPPLSLPYLILRLSAAIASQKKMAHCKAHQTG